MSRRSHQVASLARRKAGLAVLVASGLALASCAAEDKFAPACPDLRLLRDGADLTIFNGRGQDVTDLVLNARITAIPAECRAGGKGKVAATMRATLELTRGPALPGRTVTIPYFITILEGERMVQQKDYAASATFPANVDRIVVSTEDIELLFPTPPNTSAARYTVYASFRLTPAQLDYNRTRNAK